MKFRGLIIATIVLLALAGTLYWSEHRKPETSAGAKTDEPPSIVKVGEDSITKLEIKNRGSEPIVLAKESGSWKVVAPKTLGADQSAVSGVVSSLSSLTSERLVDEKATDLKSYGLEQPGVEVDVTQKDNKGYKLLIGDDTPTGGAVYAKLAGDPRVFTIGSYTKTSIDKPLNDLRDKRLVTISADKVSRVELIRKDQTVEFGRNKDDWQILKPRPMRADGTQVGELVRKLTEARMDLSGSSDAKETESSFAHGTVVATAKVTDQSGSQELQIRKNKDNYYAKSSVVDGACKVDSDLGKAVDKGLEDFRNKKLFDFGYTDPEKIEMHIGSKAYFLSRSGSDWWSNGKKMDENSAQVFVGRLRDMEASKFPDSGFSNPTVEITVTSDSGKRIEKISIAKSGKDYVAKRENEPTLYELASSSVADLQKSADDVKSAAASGK